ncbi:heavy metal translocating P-type ATPase [Cytophaga aurantiaca]|uniref:heavy metal translocating P-type ATPase n=1 Tax=Cytophaga aurantiaca TaxID=29530 RepID=UPI000368E4CA|nr:heavy metal translocating P-type ATPase metal-binding domain-containing protein [Cytophaga aurantiaca]
MVQTLKETALTCYHCGEVFRGNTFRLDDKSFCCNGCKMVYELLEERSMCTYYTLENQPGNKIKDNTHTDFAYLDNQEIVASLLNFQDGTLSGITFYIPSIHCSSCIWLLENLHSIHKGIITADIQFQRKELNVQFNTDITLRELAGLLESIGYAPLITMEGKEMTTHTVQRSIYYKLGIAGFCFGNIMMLSLPEYLSVFQDENGDLKHLFALLSLLLAMPVFFYSASGYFTSAWQALKNKVVNIDLPIALGLTAAFAQSTIEILNGTGNGYLDSLSGLVFFLLIGKWYQQKTYASLSFDRDYKSYFPLAACKVTENGTTYVALQDLQVNDLILLRNQDLIPADGILMEGTAHIDYSFVTGESIPVVKSSGEQLFAGGRQKGAAIKVKIIRPVSESYLTQLWNKDQTKDSRYGITEFTNTIGKYFTIAVLLLSAGTYLWWMNTSSSTALYAAVSVLIIFCPCTLALAIPFCFGHAMNVLGRNGFYLKNPQTIEKLSGNKVIVFDKTGTLTSAADSEVIFEGTLTAEEQRGIKSLVQNSAHPLSRMIDNHLKDQKGIAVDAFTEITSQGISGEIGNMHIHIGAAAFTGVSQDKRPIDGNGTRVYVNINGMIKGYYRCRNAYRPQLKEVLTELKSDYQLNILSGDTDAEKNFLSGYVESFRMHFQQSPENKRAYIEWLSAQHKVIMIGDGLNDAGALQQSTCGISMTETSGSFSPASDVIVDAASFQKLPAFLKYANACTKTVYWSLGVSLLYNLIGLYFAMQGYLKPLVAAILMPVSSVSIVLFVTAMSSYWAKRFKLL